MSRSSSQERLKPKRRVSGAKIGVLIGIVLAVVLGFYFFGNELSLKSLAAKESQMRRFGNENPLIVYAIAFVVYVAVTALSLPFAAVMTLVIGWYFGFWRGLILVSFASTLCEGLP